MTNLLKYIRLIPVKELRIGPNRHSTHLDRVCSDSTKFILVFDIDYCLYNSSFCKDIEIKFNTKWERRLMKELTEKTGTSEYSKTFSQLFETYGSPTEGMLKLYGKDLNYVVENGFYETYKHITRDDQLAKVLRDLPFDKYCFTNGFERRSSKILEKLGIDEVFKGIFVPNEVQREDKLFLEKPKPEAFRFVESHLNPNKNIKIVFFDDSELNIKTARSDEFQWLTYHVTPENDIYSRIKQFKEEHLNDEAKSDDSNQLPVPIRIAA